MLKLKIHLHQRQLQFFQSILSKQVTIEKLNTKLTQGKSSSTIQFHQQNAQSHHDDKHTAISA